LIVRVAGRQIDHTMKVLKGLEMQGTKFCNIRMTIFSADSNCPILSVSVNSSCYNDPGALLALEDFCAYAKHQRADVQICTIDNMRDANVLTKLLGLESSAVEKAPVITFTGKTMIVQQESEIADAVVALRDDMSRVQMSGRPCVLGFDREAFAPMKAGVSNSKSALLQLCSSSELCVLFSLKQLRGVPPGPLRDLLADARVLKVRFLGGGGGGGGVVVVMVVFEGCICVHGL
jgi:hypothetical protein